MARYRSNPLSDRPQPHDNYTEADRQRIRIEAARSVLDDLDGDRSDPAWVRYCSRHDLDPSAAGTRP